MVTILYVVHENIQARVSVITAHQLCGLKKMQLIRPQAGLKLA